MHVCACVESSLNSRIALLRDVKDMQHLSCYLRLLDICSQCCNCFQLAFPGDGPDPSLQSM